jgi:hypothetical protein
VLGLTISALLISVLLVGVGGFVEDQRERVVQTELDVVGQQLASDIAATDRLVQGSNPSTGSVGVRFESHLPNQIANTGYTVEVDGSQSRLVLRTDRPTVAVIVGIETTTELAEVTVAGGDLAIVYDPTADELEVVHDG